MVFKTHMKPYLILNHQFSTEALTCLNVYFRQTMTQIKKEKKTAVQIFAKERPESFLGAGKKSMMERFA